MSTRPFTDIQRISDSGPIKNGTLITGAQRTGFYSLNNSYVKNTPDIDTIKDKYGDKFYNGIFVMSISGVH